MKAFVTGGTGFIGERVVRELVERGYEVICLTRRPEKAVELKALGVNLVQGDINDQEAMRPAMSGADVVFHIAGWYEIGLSPAAKARMERINVQGTESVLGLAVELEVPKVVYTSTVWVLGDTHGRVVDETYQRSSSFQSAYDLTKYQAHRVAERFIAQGAPIVIVMPTAVYGPGDHSLVALALRLSLRQLLPVVPGADTGFTLVHVDDVARGHVLAAEKGEVGETYILGGDIMTLGDAAQGIARLAGTPAPLLLLDADLMAPFEPLLRWLEGFVSLPSLLSPETLRTLGQTWIATSAKAERELGYTHRPFEEGMAETIERELVRMHSEPPLITPRRQAAILLALAGTVCSLLTLWLWQRRRA